MRYRKAIQEWMAFFVLNINGYWIGFLFHYFFSLMKRNKNQDYHFSWAIDESDYVV